MGIEEIQQTQRVYGNGTVCENARSRKFNMKGTVLCLNVQLTAGSPLSVSVV